MVLMPISKNRVKRHKIFELRKEAHRLFDQMWRKPEDGGRRVMIRGTAYRNLANWFDLKYEDAHIRFLDKRQCLELIDRLKRYGLK